MLSNKLNAGKEDRPVLAEMQDPLKKYANSAFPIVEQKKFSGDADVDG